MMDDLVTAIGAWPGKARGNDDCAGIALWLLRLQAGQLSSKMAAETPASTPPALAA